MKLLRLYRRWKVKRTFLKDFYRRMEENAILQEYITARILGYSEEKPQEFRRQELLEKQGEEKELRMFIKFLKELK